MGILIRSASALENLRSVKYFLTDKTGTLTEGKPVVTDVVAYADEKRLFCVAYAVESCSSHPLAAAICNAARERVDGLDGIGTRAGDIEVAAGMGIKATVCENGDSNICLIGTPELLAQEGIKLEKDILLTLHALEEKGRTAVVCALGAEPLGIIGIFDKERADSKDAIASLKKMRVTPVMLTGDNEQTARAVCDACGIDEYRARLLPEDKERINHLLMVEKKVPDFGKAIARVNYEDGMKVYFEDNSFVICRFSGTEPLLRIFAESTDAAKARALIDCMKNFINV
jgi:Cu+-exporting ATPase